MPPQKVKKKKSPAQITNPSKRSSPSKFEQRAADVGVSLRGERQRAEGQQRRKETIKGVSTETKFGRRDAGLPPLEPKKGQTPTQKLAPKLDKEKELQTNFKGESTSKPLKELDFSKESPFKEGLKNIAAASIITPGGVAKKAAGKFVKPLSDKSVEAIRAGLTRNRAPTMKDGLLSPKVGMSSVERTAKIEGGVTVGKIPSKLRPGMPPTNSKTLTLANKQLESVLRANRISQFTQVALGSWIASVGLGIWYDWEINTAASMLQTIAKNSGTLEERQEVQIVLEELSDRSLIEKLMSLSPLAVYGSHLRGAGVVATMASIKARINAEDIEAIETGEFETESEMYERIAKEKIEAAELEAELWRKNMIENIEIAKQLKKTSGGIELEPGKFYSQEELKKRLAQIDSYYKYYLGESIRSRRGVNVSQKTTTGNLSSLNISGIV